MEVISLPDLRQLLRDRNAQAKAAGRCHVRDPHAFECHLVAVACCARRVAEQLHCLPPATRPDPIVCFLAGAWHDAGKIWNGDDYHEITSALELITFGESWRLVRGPQAEVRAVLRRAARTILPHFALHEQLLPAYAPTSATRACLPHLCATLETALGKPITVHDLLPRTTDALVLIYSDLAAEGAAFDQRWMDIERSARDYDPAIGTLLPQVRPRLRAAYEAIAAHLREGC